jgi:hypothetical protein
MAGVVGKGLHEMKQIAEKLKHRAGLRSLTQEELQMEVENYGIIMRRQAQGQSLDP